MNLFLDDDNFFVCVCMCDMQIIFILKNFCDMQLYKILQTVK